MKFLDTPSGEFLSYVAMNAPKASHDGPPSEIRTERIQWWRTIIPHRDVTGDPEGANPDGRTFNGPTEACQSVSRKKLVEFLKE